MKAVLPLQPVLGIELVEPLHIYHELSVPQLRHLRFNVRKDGADADRGALEGSKGRTGATVARDLLVIKRFDSDSWRNHRRGALPMLALDVRDDDSVRACVDRVLTENGRLDVLVNNAGVGMEGAVEETSLDEIRAVLETNFLGAVRMMRAVLPIMRKRRSGRIINIGSAAGFLPMPYSAAYCASKHALRGFSESLDHEVRGFGIRVSVIEPGFVRTDMVEHSFLAAAPFEPYISARSNPARAFRQQMAQGVDPDVVARTVLQAATEKDPRVRYLPDGTARVVALFLDVLPSSLFDFAFRRQAEMDED